MPKKSSNIVITHKQRDPNLTPAQAEALQRKWDERKRNFKPLDPNRYDY